MEYVREEPFLNSNFSPSMLPGREEFNIFQLNFPKLLINFH